MSRSIIPAIALVGFATAAQLCGVVSASAGALDPVPAYPTMPAAPSAPLTYPDILQASAAYAQSPNYDWTGFYIGANGGWSTARVHWTSDPDGTAGADQHASANVGGTIGYNSQTLGSWVVGEEFDFNWRHLDFVLPAATCGTACQLNSRWFATARLRAGYAIDRFLPYVTAGVSIGDFDALSIGQPNGVNKNVSFNFVAGAGIEVVIQGSLTSKIEYLYINHARIDCTAECNGPVHFDPNEQVLRVGLNYRFWQR